MATESYHMINLYILSNNLYRKDKLDKNMELKTIKQHYVPQFYLRNFEDKQHKLYVYNRQKDKFIESRTKDICREKCLYETQWENANPKLGKYILPNQIEDDFSRQESKYNTLLKKIIDICSEPKNENALICNQTEKKELALFVANMLLRNLWSLEHANIDDIPDELMEDNEIQSIDQLLQMLGLGGTESLIKHSSKKVWLDSELNSGKNVPTFIACDLQKMFMSFLVTQSAYFVTSSFPVIFETYKSEDNKTHCQNLFMPLCPKIALQYTKNLTMKASHNRQIPVFPETVEKINRLYMKGSPEQFQFLISHSNNVLRNVIL